MDGGEPLYINPLFAENAVEMDARAIRNKKPGN